MAGRRLEGVGSGLGVEGRGERAPIARRRVRVPSLSSSPPSPPSARMVVSSAARATASTSCCDGELARHAERAVLEDRQVVWRSGSTRWKRCRRGFGDAARSSGDADDAHVGHRLASGEAGVQKRVHRRATDHWPSDSALWETRRGAI